MNTDLLHWTLALFTKEVSFICHTVIENLLRVANYFIWDTGEGGEKPKDDWDDEGWIECCGEAVSYGHINEIGKDAEDVD